MWFKFWKKKKPNLYTQTLDDHKDPIETPYHYHCKLFCPILKTTLLVSCHPIDDKVVPEFNCPCGKRIRMLDAPVEKVVLTKSIKLRTTRNQLLSLYHGDGHKVSLGKIFKTTIETRMIDGTYVRGT